MKLNIYEKRKIVKAYTAEEYDIMTGTVEDVLEAIGIDKIELSTDMDVIKFVAKAIAGNLDIIKRLMKDVFDGITDAELRNTKVKEIAKVVVDLVQYTFAEVKEGVSGKN